MKAKLIITVLASMFAVSAAVAQDVRYARVVSVTANEKMYSSYELGPTVCTIQNVPVERQIPIYREVYGNNGNQAAGMIIGAVIGNRIFDSSNGSRIAGTFLGAVVGNSLASDSRRTIVEYRSEVHYVEQQYCGRKSEFVTRPVIDSYNVVYELDGVLRSVVMRNPPGERIRITTTMTIEN